LIDEASIRRPGFRQERRIRLADGQMWTLPAPPRASERESPPFGSEYTDLVQAIMEAEDGSEQRLAELAFAIFLLGHNYSLSPSDYSQLLGFPPESSELTDWQVAFHHIAQEHLHPFLDTARFPLETGPVLPRPGRFARLLAWLRNRLPFRWWSVDSRILRR
jgi:hypothetical protein